MIEFDISSLIPKFIMQDKNGFALAKAIERGVQMFNEIIQDSIDCILDVDKMPEWRLDELAQEYNILYDYTADVETKRKWIAKAGWYASMYGTKEGLKTYLRAAFDTVNIDEWWKYGGDPYHFRIQVTGQYTPETNAWAIKSIDRVKSLRSVLDSIEFYSAEVEADLSIGAAISGMEIVADSRML